MLFIMVYSVTSKITCEQRTWNVGSGIFISIAANVMLNLFYVILMKEQDNFEVMSTVFLLYSVCNRYMRKYVDNI